MREGVIFNAQLTQVYFDLWQCQSLFIYLFSYFTFYIYIYDTKIQNDYTFKIQMPFIVLQIQVDQHHLFKNTLNVYQAGYKSEINGLDKTQDDELDDTDRYI